MNNVAQDVRELLGRYMSPISAKSILDLSVSWSGVDLAQLANGDVERLMAEMDKGIQLYVRRPDLHQECLERLGDLLRNTDSEPPEQQQTSTRIEVCEEDDIVTARNIGRDLCQQLGFSLTIQIKVATAISELARNIIQYAGHGEIRVATVGDNRRGIEIVSTDRGPGIADVDLILSGLYQSRTGMGIGLLGTKRLMDEFEVNSTPGAGTEVRAVMFPD
jgi:serine/threonine-protein kinase RsbT